MIRTSEGGATGIEIANARIAARHDVVLAHALPESVDVEVSDGSLVAIGEDLRAGEPLPMSKLTVDGLRVLRENLWPTDDELGLPVILPGGEAGILRSWWNDDERRSWRWTVEFSHEPSRPSREGAAVRTPIADRDRTDRELTRGGG
jgi:hypothetical protein